MTNIWTMQLSNWRLAKARNISILDVTFKTGIPMFAPPSQLVFDYKRGIITDNFYTEQYNDVLDYTMKHYPGSWETLLKYENVAVACYCSYGKFCHRHIFAQRFKEYLEERNAPVNLMGELLKNAS